jgi:hypothetical protein
MIRMFLVFLVQKIGLIIKGERWTMDSKVKDKLISCMFKYYSIIIVLFALAARAILAGNATGKIMRLLDYIIMQ